MLDMKRIRNEYDEVKKAIETRGQGDFGLEKIMALDKNRRELLKDMEEMKHEQNKTSKEIPRLKKEGQDTTEIMEAMKKLSEDIKTKNALVSEVDSELKDALLNIPNTPNPKVPQGKDDSDNIEIKKHGEPRVVDFEEKPHWDIGEKLDILDFEEAAKISGARFVVYKGLGAKLERAVINFMLDLHTGEHGFKEILPPFMVNRDSMTGTGQLPKFEDDMFHIPAKDTFMIPTAEVPLTNLLRDDIVDGDKLPIYYTAYTPCFRKEAGSAGKDTRGLIRLHQFNKVELVKFTKPEDSYDELETLLQSAEKVLQLLEIPYRVVLLSTGDLGFASAMTYDIEVWMPSYGRYVEISSCSNFEDFQARRAGIRFRRSTKDKAEFAHTLNGSGLAVGRTVAAILENYQQADGTVIVPEKLRHYMGTDIIE